MGTLQPLQKPPGFRDPNVAMNHRPMPPQPGMSFPPSFHPGKKKKKSSLSCCRIFCCCFFITLIMLILLLISVGGLLYVWFEPRYPELHFMSLDSNHFEINPSSAGPTLRASSNIQVELRNPNRHLRVQYEASRISIRADNADAVLGEETLPAFLQERHNVTRLNFTASIDDEILDQRSAGALTNDFRNRNLRATAEVRTEIAYVGHGWNTGTIPVMVVCSGLRFGEEVDNVKPRCRIQILNLFYIN